MTVNFTLHHKDTKILVDIDEAAASQPQVGDDCVCTPGRKYAYAYKNMADLDGVSAIIKVRYPVKLCCEEDAGTTTAFGVAYCNVSGPGHSWAQTGFGRERRAGGVQIRSYRYAEVQGAEYQVVYDSDNAPPNSSLHAYKCVLDVDAGTWSFSDGDDTWVSYTDVAWEGTLGTSFQYTGEIYNTEDDMAGTAADKCTFRDCKYSQAGHFVGAGLANGDVRSDDPHNWGAEFVSATGLNIWNI